MNAPQNTSNTNFDFDPATHFNIRGEKGKKNCNCKHIRNQWVFKPTFMKFLCFRIETKHSLSGGTFKIILYLLLFTLIPFLYITPLSLSYNRVRIKSKFYYKFLDSHPLKRCLTIYVWGSRSSAPWGF